MDETSSGRVYDPALGRFLSADPLVQAPFNTQSYNRYSYVFNNPLSFTDPTGYECFNVNVGSQTAGGAEGSTGNQYHSQSQTIATGGSLCGQDALDFAFDWQNQTDRNWDYMTQNFQISYSPQNMQSNGFATGLAIPIEGNSFAGAGCGVLGICLGDSVEDDANLGAAARVVDRSTLLIAGIAAPGPGGKVKTASKVTEALKVEVGRLVATHGKTMSNKQLDKLIKNIREDGIKDPLIVTEHQGKLYILDGHHRALAAPRAGITEVPIIKIDLPFGSYKTSNDLTFTPGGY